MSRQSKRARRSRDAPKVQPNHRIDIFDADVFATVRMLEDMGKTDTEGWFDS